ncbi:BRICHOS domain-containing protein 5-like isoform X1 [Huso huso]|uniref:BRICHOS domain-containing protein 5-like isoform X1 n=1 Tax=Huso huso TaxID=61971 RepID=A0ABR0YTW0_HUSHU|nr:BRICHOS domain-containing protein 5-like isoform X1 [Acipenser ruthenus]
MERLGGCMATCRGEKHNTEGDRRLESKPPNKILWGSLTAVLILTFIAITVIGILGFKPNNQKSFFQIVRISFQDQSGSLVNQSALVDKQKDVVTYYVTSQTNHTTAVLFDLQNGLLCYKPDNQDTCFLRKMESADLENVQTILNMSKHKVNQFWLQGNQTRYHTEFLGVLGRNQVEPLTLGEPFQTLCDRIPIFWVRKAQGPGKQRLIYFCIDICFPNNICVSVCFYYLPD